MSHAAGVMGGLMLMHGGYSTEGRLVLDDFNLFDFKLMKWITCITATNGVVFES